MLHKLSRIGIKVDGGGAGVCVCRAVTRFRAVLREGTAGGVKYCSRVSMGNVWTGAAGVEDSEPDAASGFLFRLHGAKEANEVFDLGRGGLEVPCCSAGAGDMECLRKTLRNKGSFMSQIDNGVGGEIDGAHLYSLRPHVSFCHESQ